ncbi:hypothetical protein LbDm2_2513 [Levilactobacillus brevis]|nr:hypothetical protein [Levilactobacillus brevis]KID41795.1 hypothetical protein LbDm2_2513 [Levilactobacillus brevis]QCZ43804.1 hypothetical protein UCCLBBS124_1480 [Levilactobacillus brevis]
MIIVDFIDLTPIQLRHTPLGTRGQLPILHNWQLDWHKLAASTWATPAILVTFHNELTQAFACYCQGRDPDFHYLGSRGID